MRCQLAPFGEIAPLPVRRKLERIFDYRGARSVGRVVRLRKLQLTLRGERTRSARR
jgi:hypothetical protein